MSNTEQLQPEQAKTRAFDPSRIPITEASRSLVADVLERLVQVEKRQRARKGAQLRTFQNAVAALVCDLAHWDIKEPGGWLTAEMSNRELSPSKRRAPFMTRTFPDVVRLLATKGLDFMEIELGDQRSWGGRRTAVRAGTWLRGRIFDPGLSYEDLGRDTTLLGPAVELRGEKQIRIVAGKPKSTADRLPWPTSDHAARVVEQMIRINRWLAEAPLGWMGEAEDDSVELSDRFMRRIFNNGSLADGGRLYGGFWQSISSRDRLSLLLIDGEPVASLDLGQSSLRQAYAAVASSPPEGDLYEIPGFRQYRSEIKTLLNALLAADDVPKQFPAKSRGRIPSKVRFAEVLQAVSDHHRPLVPLFGTAQAFRFMFQESEVLIRTMLRLQEAGVVALPIHDCVLVPVSAAESAAAVMREAFMEVIGAEAVVDIQGSLSGDIHQGAPASTIGMNRYPSGLPICGQVKAA